MRTIPRLVTRRRQLQQCDMSGSRVPCTGHRNIRCVDFVSLIHTYLFVSGVTPFDPQHIVIMGCVIVHGLILYTARYSTLTDRNR